MASFSLATSESYKDRDGNRVDTTEWHNIVAWEKLAELSEDELFQVATVPPDSVLNEYRELLRTDDVTLDVDDAAVREIVRCAGQKRLGARGLRGVLEDVLHDLMFEAPEHRGRTVRVDVSYVRRRLDAVDADALRDD